ncbi:MAG TPA: RNA methyltransferase, partial [Acidimicrobiia bacterium]|nr:RNA methyltransferase [Acidimicrobiia bacterium]
MTNRGLGARHAEVQRLRALARDRHARRTEHAFLLEGPLLLEAALDRDAPLEAVYLGYGARAAFPALLARLTATGIPVQDLREGVLEKVGTTRTPQPVLAVATLPTDPQLPPDGDVLVAVDVADPGNLGTMIRSAEAAGATAVVVTGASVDPHNPKAVRSSAGAILGLPIVEQPDPATALDALHDQGRHTVGTTARGGRASDTLDVTTPIALVVGNEAHGLAPDVQSRLD